MNNASIDPISAQEQETKYRRLVKDSAKHATDLALGKTKTDQDGWQRVLEHGDELRTAIAEVIVAKTRELSISNQYANEEVKSRYAYFSGYQKPVEIADQIDILRAHWPKLNADKALRYMHEVYPKLQFPSWVEGPFALIRPGFFSNLYGEEIEEVLKALAKVYSGKFHNYLEGKLGPEYLRKHAMTLAAMNRLLEQQPGDIIIAPEQFGIRHRGPSVRRAREVFTTSEFGEGAKNVGTMILTNPNRLKHHEDLWIDCAGDEYSLDADGKFGNAPYFNFNDEQVKFDTNWVDNANDNYGSASGSLPKSLINEGKMPQYWGIFFISRIFY